MGTISKPNTFSSGTTILSAEVNSNFDTIYDSYNGGISNANISGSAAIADTKLAQITTASKVSGAALTSLSSIPTQTDTTADSFQLTNNSLTTGRAMIIDSTTTVLTGAGRAFLVDHPGTSTISGVIAEVASSAVDETVILRATAGTVLAGGVIFDVAGTSMTTGTAIKVDSLDALTSGIGLDIESGATAITGAGRLLFSDHSGASSTSGILNEFKTAAADETVLARFNATAAITGVVMDITASGLTTGTVLDMGDIDAITTGTIVNVISDSSNTAVRNLVVINNDNTAATSAIPLLVNQDAEGVFMNLTGSSGATTVDAVSTHGTSSATTDHIRIKLNGVDAWIAISTTTPSA